MKKKTLPKVLAPAEDDDMLPEYDFSGGERGKHYQARQKGYTIKIHKRDGTTLVQHITRAGDITLEPDVREYFPNSQAVNHALRTLIALFPEQRKRVSSRTSSQGSQRRSAS
jgi:hypothetical protein